MEKWFTFSLSIGEYYSNSRQTPISVKYPALKGEACGRTNPNKPVAITDFSFHRGWYPIPLHEGCKPPYARYLEPRCGRGQVLSHMMDNGTYVQTTSV